MTFSAAKFLTLPAIALCIAAAKIETPKGREYRQSLGSTMGTRFDPLVVPSTNKVYHATFAWDYQADQFSTITNFHLYIGLAPGTYSIDEWAGTNFNGTNFTYTFYRTNWSERLDRHWAVMTAADNQGLESDPSNEVHWPRFQDDHFTLHWTTSHALINIYASTNLTVPKSQWQLIATVSNTNQWSAKMIDYQFFYIMTDSAETLWVTTFNPNP